MLQKWTDEARYNLYKLRFEEKVESLYKKGIIPDETEPMSKREYFAEYDARVETYKIEGRKKGNVLKDIIEDQVYTRSKSQTQALAKALIKEGEEKSYVEAINKIRSGEIENTIDNFFKSIEERREELFQQTDKFGLPKYSKADIAYLIATEFFWES